MVASKYSSVGDEYPKILVSTRFTSASLIAGAVGNSISATERGTFSTVPPTESHFDEPQFDLSGIDVKSYFIICPLFFVSYHKMRFIKPF